jgi:hypothetical protein
MGDGFDLRRGFFSSVYPFCAGYFSGFVFFGFVVSISRMSIARHPPKSLSAAVELF